MFKKRIKMLLFVFNILIACLILRLFCLQVKGGNNLYKAASMQRMADTAIDKPRGNIIDKNGIPFTNRNKKFSIVLKPLFLRGKDKEISMICQVLKYNVNEMTREVDIKKEPIVIDVSEKTKNDILLLNINGVSAVNSLIRFDDRSIARHVIGYLNKTDEIGGYGLEHFYESELKINKKNSLCAVVDARNNLVQGLGYRILAPNVYNDEAQIKLTLDYHIQNIVENVLDSNKITGAVVVEDVNSGDILAMASKPDFNQNSIERYLKSGQKELFNRAAGSYSLGSIFKVIDVAQLFESNIYKDKKFFCAGSMKIGNKVFKCASYERGGHGHIALKEAFSKSCNAYFIDMGLCIGKAGIINMAKKFGMGAATGIDKQGIAESSGNLPPIKTDMTYGDIANISIGQGQIMATPLQVANIIAIVANGGIKNKINIVDSIIDKSGRTVKMVKEYQRERIISKSTADKIKELMEETTNTGTGSKARLQECGGAGGKTGSAETGEYINGVKVVHAWFAGYFPRKNPKYSISVFVENGKTGSGAATPIFSEIARELAVKSFLKCK